MQNKDTWTLGGHTFTSRFILGSGKYNLNLIRAAVEDAGAEIITLALRRVNTRKEENILDYIPEREMPKKLFVWQDWHVKWDVVILSK